MSRWGDAACPVRCRASLRCRTALGVQGDLGELRTGGGSPLTEHQHFAKPLKSGRLERWGAGN